MPYPVLSSSVPCCRPSASMAICLPRQVFFGCICSIFSQHQYFWWFFGDERMLAMFKSKDKKPKLSQTKKEMLDEWEFELGRPTCGLVLFDCVVLFILTLRGLSSPKTAIRGNRFGMMGMALAIITTFSWHQARYCLDCGCDGFGCVVGTWKARTVAMTQMPETVALMHSLVGLSAVAIAFS